MTGFPLSDCISVQLVDAHGRASRRETLRYRSAILFMASYPHREQLFVNQLFCKYCAFFTSQR